MASLNEASSNSNTLPEVKIALVGGGGIGAKTALAKRFLHNYFFTEYAPTIEDTYHSKRTIDGEDVILHILDTAGQEEFAAMRPQIISQNEGFLVGYSIRSRDSFEDIQQNWLPQIIAFHGPQAAMVLVGHMADLEDERQVSKQEGEDLAEKYHIPFFETSAKTGQNVAEAIYQLVREIRKK
eukprot:CAMPEP_0168571534 /NCGR_PEP_ID=MMETSP0413-20121227/17398_1 /TAXON_ID=136452 /ORGANISM="Filamoeba nolandi, Strain NC-AS-23-1" /LENGTH=181 /DNA_ID=CAMNT_0008604415 /DNA_START=8 /DNA_END=550 /DNA_ORIENTATION=+